MSISSLFCPGKMRGKREPQASQKRRLPMATIWIDLIKSNVVVDEAINPSCTKVFFFRWFGLMIPTRLQMQVPARKRVSPNLLTRSSADPQYPTPSTCRQRSRAFLACYFASLPARLCGRPSTATDNTTHVHQILTGYAFSGFYASNPLLHPISPPLLKRSLFEYRLGACRSIRIKRNGCDGYH